MSNDNSSEIKTKPIGIIIPPPDIRKIVDKTAEFVAKNGSTFEELVIKSEQNNPKFSFLKTHDPYRAYYDQKVIEFARGLIEPMKEEPKAVEPQPVALQITQKKDLIKQKDVKKEVKPPPADQYAIQVPQSLNIVDMDIIKLTAQFVAKNGQKFLIALTEREKQNPQFDFLKPTHQLFPFFTNLVDAYSKCIAPRKEEVERLKENIVAKMSILNRCGERFDFENTQLQAKKKKEEIDEEERAQMALIDWNDFIVVETIDLYENEELPAPADFRPQPTVNNAPGPQSLPASNSHAQPQQPQYYQQPPPSQAAVQPHPGAREETDLTKKALAKDVRLPTSKPNAVQVAAPDVAAPTSQAEPGMKIRKDYVPKSSSGEKATNKCPLCQQYIPVSDFNEHLRIEMLDPRYKEIKQQVETRNQNITMAEGEEVAANLANFAKRRPDLFGSVEEQIPAEERKKAGDPPKILWDGQAANMNRTTANQAMLAQQQKRNLEEQMKTVSDTIKKDGIPIPGVPLSALPKPLITPPINLPPPITTPLPLLGAGKVIPPASVFVPSMIQTAPVLQPSAVQMQNPLSGLPRPQSGPQNLPNPLDGTKKLKTEEDNLIPEEQWLQTNPGPITLNVRIPNIEGEEAWDLKGQMIQVKFEPTNLISDLKEQLSERLGGMPAAKQKLRSALGNINLKDENTIAYYNFINGSVVELSAKERGGRAHK
jgi:splicing factor 3A subunit 1